MASEDFLDEGLFMSVDGLGMEMDGKDREKGPRVLYPGSGAGRKGAEVYERCMKLLSVTTKHARSPSRATWAARSLARGLDKHKKI